MLPSFSTQISDDEPKVILIGDETVLAQHITAFFKEKSLQVTTVPTSKTNTVSASDAIYKIIWICDATVITNEDIQKVKESLRHLTVPLVILMPIITAIKSHDAYTKWTEASKKQTQVITDLSTQFSQAHFIFFENLFETTQPLTLPKLITEYVKTHIILDPDNAFSGIDVATALQSIEEPLFRPGFHRSIIVKGQEFSSEMLVTRIQQQYHHVHKLKTEIKKTPVVIISAVPFTVEEKIVTADLEEVIAECVRNLPKVEKSDSLDDSPEPNLPKPNQRTRETVIEQKPLPPVIETVEPQIVIEPEVVTENTLQDEDKNKKNFQSESDVQQELQRIFAHNRIEKKVKRVAHIAEVEDKIVKKSKHKKVLFWGGLGVVGGGMSLLSLVLSFYLSTLIVKQGLFSVVQAASNPQVTIDWNRLEFATNVLSFQTEKYNSVVDNALISQAAELVTLSENVQKLNTTSEQVDTTITGIYKQLMSGGSSQASTTFAALQSKAAEHHQLLTDIQAQLETTDFNTLESSQEQQVQAFKQNLSTIVKNAGITQQLAPLLPHLTGVDAPRTYAIVLQNNQELRPTGGFIQSIALITVQNGTITETEFISSYDLDAKLSGTVTPPEEITQLLGEERWFLRDANWDPDFSTSAERIALFIENSTNKKISGIMGLDVYGLEKILKATGPLNLPQYNEVITDKNVAERLEFHSEVTFIDKENNPDYTTVLFSTLFNSLKSLPDENITSIFESLQLMTKESNLLLALRDPNENMTVKSLGWSGNLISPDCPSALGYVDCYVDTVAQVEANIGVNKANYYVDRSINHVVTLSPSLAQHKRTITYRNKAQTNTWPKGNYKAFVRMYLPATVNLKSIYFNTSPIPLEQITVKDVENRKVVGFLIDVPINSQSIVEVEYEEQLDKKLPYSYAFFEQKQPGTPVTPFTLTVVPPADAQPVLIAPEAQVHSNTVLFQDEQKTHLFYGVQFE